MKGYTDRTYGDRIAEVYDQLYGSVGSAIIDLLQDLAGRGPVLELGIGTGRVAIPLVERGLEVHGIDASAVMLEQLGAKPAGRRIKLTTGDFSTLPMSEHFSLVYVVFNTFFALLTQEAQVRCFQQVAAHLQPGGCFLLECFVPDLSRFVRGQNFTVNAVDLSRVYADASCHDPVGQRISSQHIFLTEEGIRLFPVELRYAWPSELDLMAVQAGLRRRDRWAGWEREPFAATSQRHISVYERPS